MNLILNQYRFEQFIKRTDRLNRLGQMNRSPNSRVRAPPSAVGGPTASAAAAAAVWDTDSLTENMAEAAAVPPHRFFCHCCKGEVNPKLPVSPRRL